MRARNHSGRWACAMLALALSACHAGSDNAAEVQPPDTAAQKIPARPDPDQPVASGNTAAAADVAALAALNARFDPARDAAADLEMAKVEAQRGGKRIVLELGDAACAECAVLDERIEGEAPLRHRRDAGFIWVKVDRSAPGNVAFLAAYPGSAEAHAPHLLVLDADGQVLHAQSGHDLLRKGKPDRRRIEAFLEEWAPPEAPAQP